MKSPPRDHPEPEGPRQGDDEFRLDLPPEPTYVSMARLFAASVGRQFGCREDVVEDIKVAISEIATNAVKAHQRANAPEPVTLRARLEGDALSFDVIDAGPGFDVAPHDASGVAPHDASGVAPHDASGDGSRAPAPAVVAHQGAVVAHQGNLGLPLVRSLFPTTRVRRNPGRGMTVGFSLDLAASRRETVAST